MKFNVTTPLRKILAPIICIAVPLMLLRDILTVINTRPRLFESFDDVTLGMFTTDKLRLDLAAVALVVAFLGIVGRLYVPPIEWKISRDAALKGLGIAFFAISISSLGSWVTDGLNRDSGSFPFMIPGAAHLPVLSVLCFGVIEAFRSRVKEVQLFGVALAGYLVILLFGQITISPFSPFFEIAAGTLKAPLISIDTYWRDWRGYLPFAHVLLGVLVYIRLGVAALLTFMFSASVLVMIVASIGIRPNVTSIGYWLTTVIAIFFVERYLRAKTSAQ